MKNFQVEICETFIKIVSVEAKNEQEALKLVRNDYDNKKIVLDNDFFDVDFNIIDGED